jgi:predicted DNA-binding protein
MKRISLFLTEKQIKKLAAIADEIAAPKAAVIRHAIDYYLEVLKDTGIKPRVPDGRIRKSLFFQKSN